MPAPKADDSSKGPAASLWQKLRAATPYILAVGLFAFGLYALYRLLAPVDLNDVADNIRATPWSVLAFALGATLVAYLALVGYDWSALRYIGKPLPLPVVITGGLMAYAFGNTIGLSAVSGGAVRYRIYSGLGLDGYDVAAVSTFAAVSFGFAATVVGLGALALHPAALAAVLPFPETLVRLVAFAGILAIIGPLLVASWRRGQLRYGRFVLRAPSLPVLGGQVLFSMLDIGSSAMVLYMLLPETDISFLTFLAVFAAATMAGILSHVPGGVGVFETVVIAAMPFGTPVDKVAAALLLYRMIYYLVPFVLALIVLAMYEAWLALGASRAARPGAVGRALTAMQPALGAVAVLAPLVLSAVIFGSGLWMTFAALIPPTSEAAEALEALFPLAFIEGSALLSSALGAGLIVLALGVARRSRTAFVLALCSMAAGVAVALAQGFDTRRASALMLVLLILLPFRREFNRRTRLTNSGSSLGWALLVLSTVFAFGFVAFFANKSTAFAYEMWWQFAIDSRAPRALRAGMVASLAVGVGALFLLLHTPRLRPVLPDNTTLNRARQIFRASGRPGAGFALMGDKALLLSGAGDALLMFGVRGRSWIALGGPVGARDAGVDLAWTFADEARRAGARPVFYEVEPADLPLMHDLGLSQYQLGEEAQVDLRGFGLAGARRAELAEAQARGIAAGLSLDVVKPPHRAELLAALRTVSDDWLAARRAAEKSFSAGRFDRDWLNRWSLALLRQGGRIIGFATILTTDSKQLVTLDMVRFRRDAPPEAMEFLVTALMLVMKAQGYARFSLGMAPMAGLQARRAGRIWHRFGAALFRHGGNFRNFAALRDFKAKYDPVWSPRYIAVPSSTKPFLPLTDIAMLITGAREPRRRFLAKR